MENFSEKKSFNVFPYIFSIIGILIAILLVLWVKNWSQSSVVTVHKKIQKITIIAPPPPPPPPPEETPPEPDIEEEAEQPEEEIAEEMPEDVAAPAESLGVDSDGSAGGDSFGLIGRKGGRGLLDGSPFSYYEGLMVSEIQTILAEIDTLKSQEYEIRIKITIAFDGTVKSIKLIKSTGDKKRDKMLLSTLQAFNKFSQMPPAKMPPVIDLKITSTI